MKSNDSNVQRLLAPARSFSPGDDGIWRGHQFIWKQPDSWIPRLTAWFALEFREDGLRRLKPGVFRDLCWDDFEWSELLESCIVGDLDCHAERLADALDSAVFRTYHGCRTEDAGNYLKRGLQVHDRPAMTAKLRTIVNGHEELSWLKPRLDAEIARVDNSLDIGYLYVVADDKSLLEYAAHYLIYGSEWIAAVLGVIGQQVLRRSGVPTLLEIDLPLRVVNFDTRKALAGKMLTEWTRRACNEPDWHAPIDFSFCLCVDIPPAWVVGHSHPTELRDPLEQCRLYRPTRTTCAYCAAENSNDPTQTLIDTSNRAVTSSKT